eukprot:5408001-Alexandrium_andersonii.AAC.1
MAARSVASRSTHCSVASKLVDDDSPSYSESAIAGIAFGPLARRKQCARGNSAQSEFRRAMSF